MTADPSRRSPRPHRVFRLLLRCFPASFRKRWGNEAEDLFRELQREARGGARGQVRLWVLLVWDSITSGLAERWAERRPPEPSRGPAQRLKHKGDSLMATLFQDLKHSARALRRSPLFVLVTVMTLALGIGANAAVFSVLDRVVLNPLPFRNPQELVQFFLFFGEQGPQRYFSAPMFLDYRRELKSFQAVGALYNYSDYGATFTGQGQPRRVSLMPVSADYFKVFGVSPAIGRGFVPEDEVVTANVAVVSHRFWTSVLNSDPGVLGRVLTLDGAPFEVVGVMPADFQDVVGGYVDLWLPQDLTTPEPVSPLTSTSWNNRGNHYLSVVGRLKDGVTLAQAQAELDAFHVRLGELYSREAEKRARIRPLLDTMVAGVRPALYVLMGAALLVLLIACVNLANLFQVRNGGRERELAVRAALGSSGGHLVRHLMLDVILVLILGGLAGLGVAHVGVDSLTRLIPGSLPRAREIRPDGTLFLFALAVTGLSGLLFGLLPALRFRRPDVAGALRESIGGWGGGWGPRALGNGLVTTQITLALILLVGAGLLSRSFLNLQRVDLGMAPGHVLTLEVQLPSTTYGDPLMRTRFHRTFEERVAALPGVEAVGAVSWLPGNGAFNDWGVQYRNAAGEAVWGGANFRVIEGDYFGALNIEMVKGRTFRRSDDVDAPSVAIVSESLARAYFPDREPLGQRIGAEGRAWTIVGVVKDVATGGRGEIVRKVYLPHAQFAADRNWRLTEVIETTASRPGLLDEVRSALREVDPGLVPFNVRTMDEVLATSRARDRLALLLMGIFSLLALVLAGVGIYGVLASSVAKRTREIGIRMALGADGAQVGRRVLGQAGMLVLTGTGLGLLGAWVLSRFMGSLLFGVEADDLPTFLTVPSVLLVVACAAVALPVFRAVRVDPVEAIRRE